MMRATTAGGLVKPTVHSLRRIPAIIRALSTSSAADRRFLVVSLGNPAPYLETLHSAGHHALEAFQELNRPEQPAFTRQRIGKKAAMASLGQKYMLAQSPTMMNISGPWVAAAWREMLATHDLAPSELGLVVVHDDLEEALGVVKLRDWNKSHRGHNGIKSIQATMRPDSGTRWSRISIGIGRPEAREKGAVSDYVLRNMTSAERLVIRERAGQGIAALLRDLESK